MDETKTSAKANTTKINAKKEDVTTIQDSPIVSLLENFDFYLTELAAANE